MSCCGAEYELNPEVGRQLLRGEEAEIREADLTLCHDGSGNQSHGDALPAQTQKKCAECGYEADADFFYCPKCGSRL